MFQASEKEIGVDAKAAIMFFCPSKWSINILEKAEKLSNLFKSLLRGLKMWMLILNLRSSWWRKFMLNWKNKKCLFGRDWGWDRLVGWMIWAFFVCSEKGTNNSMQYENFISYRYLTSSKGQFLSFLNFISIGGVAIGVMALIVVLGVIRIVFI